MWQLSGSIRAFLAAVFMAAGAAQAAPFAIAVNGPPGKADITTHEIRSRDVILGFSETGGGYINKLFIPGIGDLIATESARYGRGGQITIRDELHGRKYNPTQAGFSRTAGTHVEIQMVGNEARMPRRPMALFHGDGAYDFTEWENLGPDPYRDDQGRGDRDGIDESKLPGRQADEITSEFDFAGTYSSVYDGDRIRIPAFRFYYELSYIRSPGHAISQFGSKTPIYDPSGANNDISVEAPAGVHPSTETTLSHAILSSTIQGDLSVWNPSVLFTMNEQGGLAASTPKEFSYALGKDRVLAGQPLVIFATSRDPASGVALGFLQPNTQVNTYNIVGRAVVDGSQQYLDRRTNSTRMIGTLRRGNGKMWLLGAKVHLQGMLSRLEAPAGMYETVRGETYLLVGTPAEILDAARKLSPPLAAARTPNR